MTLFGASPYSRVFFSSDVLIIPKHLFLSFSTLATDRGFKERVREDMLVRLLDAFVWRNHGNSQDGMLSVP